MVLLCYNCSAALFKDGGLPAWRLQISGASKHRNGAMIIRMRVVKQYNYPGCGKCNYNIKEKFQAWKRDYELKNGIEYIQNTGQKKCKDGQRDYYECCRTGFHKEGENLKRMIKTQGSKKINQNCTSHIILFEPFEGKCEVTFYKEHYEHKEIELQHIKIPDIKKHEIAAKVLDDVRENIGNSLKREDLITRSDLHNIKQKYNLNLKDGQFHKSDATSVDIW
ncbi:MULE domain-containing protein, partial [Aphis craccivora]